MEGLVVARAAHGGGTPSLIGDRKSWGHSVFEGGLAALTGADTAAPAEPSAADIEAAFARLVAGHHG
jgi:hypothetical protein